MEMGVTVVEKWDSHSSNVAKKKELQQENKGEKMKASSLSNLDSLFHIGNPCEGLESSFFIPEVRTLVNLNLLVVSHLKNQILLFL